MSKQNSYLESSVNLRFTCIIPVCSSLSGGYQHFEMFDKIYISVQRTVKLMNANASVKCQQYDDQKMEYRKNIYTTLTALYSAVSEQVGTV